MPHGELSDEFKFALNRLSKVGDPLEKLGVLDWESFRPEIEAVLAKNEDEFVSPFDTVVLFKVMVLQKFYNLTDKQAEFGINDRLSFIRFLDTDPFGPLPDAAAIENFRLSIGRAGGVKKLFKLLDKQLDLHLIVPHKGHFSDADFTYVMGADVSD